MKISSLMCGILVWVACICSCGPQTAQSIDPSKLNALVLKQESPMWEIKDGKSTWKASLTIGEMVYASGSTQKAIQGEDGEKEYVSIKRADNSEGWIRPVYIAVKAISGVVMSEKAVLYSQPNNTSASTRTLLYKQVVGVYQEGATDTFLKIAAYDMQKKEFINDLYIRKDDISTLEADAQSAIILQVAQNSKNADQKKALLTSALKDYPSSHFVAEIQLLEADLLAPVTILSEAYTARMKINDNNVNIRSKPDVAGDIIAQLQKDNTVEIIERTASPTAIDGKNARWYHINTPADGWVYGAFIEGAE